MKIPIGFSSIEEYNAYRFCLRKARPLDTAIIYLTLLYNLLAHIRHKLFLRSTVSIIGIRRFDNSILLGTNNSINFWKMDYNSVHKEIKIYSNYKDIISRYQYGFWASVGQVRIAKLNLKNAL